MPAGSVGADFELGRERALGDLTVDGGPGESRPDKNGFQANDTVWVSHGHAASCSLLLTASETRQDRVLQARKGILHIDALWRSNGGESDGSDSDAPASAEVEAVGKGEFEAEPAACFEGNAEFDFAVGEDRFTHIGVVAVEQDAGACAVGDDRERRSPRTGTDDAYLQG